MKFLPVTSSTLLFIFLFSGCALQPDKKDQTVNQSVEGVVQKHALSHFSIDDIFELRTDNPYNRRYTAEWGNTGRGGSAIRHPGMIHVLSRPERTVVMSADDLSVREMWQQREVKLALTESDNYKDDLSGSSGLLDKDVIDNKTDESDNEISDELMAIYVKYCDPLLELTEEELQKFIDAGGIKSIPSSLSTSCVHSK